MIQILEDSKSHQNFQITDPYSMFQEEHADLEKSIESMILFQNDPLDMIEAKLSRLENMRRNKETLPTQSLTIPNISSHIDENQESWYLEDFDQDSILTQNLELDQYQPIDELASFHFNEIELDYEREPDPQLCDSVSIFESMVTLILLSNLDQFFEPTFIPIPIDLEIESPILDSHIPLMEKECEFLFLDLDSTLEPKLTLELKVNFLELVLVPEPIILESKSTIPLNHILLLDIHMDHDDSVMIFQDSSCKGNKFHDRIFHNFLHIGDCKNVNRKEVNKGGFREPLHYLD